MLYKGKAAGAVSTAAGLSLAPAGFSLPLLVSVLPLLVSLFPCWSLLPPAGLSLALADLSCVPVLGQQPCAIHLPNVCSLLAIISLHDCSQTVHKSSLDSNKANTTLINNLLWCLRRSSVSPPFMAYNNIASVTA